MIIADPSVSLIINTTDRARPLQTLLRSLERQSYANFEVIVVVGPTRDNTLEILSSYQERVRVLRCPEANLSRSRNIGLLAARGEIVAYIDDDAVPSRRWLEQLAGLFRGPSALDATGGVVYLIHSQKPMVQHRLGLLSSLFEQQDVRDSWLDYLPAPGEGAWWIVRPMGTNMAFRRKVLLELGGFDEFYIYVAEEADVAMRLAQAGKYLYPVREASVYHIPASSRNREVFTYTGRWWLQTRSGTYFVIKNGPAAGESWQSVWRRSLQLVHGHWLWLGHLCRTGEISRRQAWTMRLQELWGFCEGAMAGLFRQRRLIRDPEVKEALRHAEPIRLFQSAERKEYRAVDPITGRQPSLSTLKTPLRICLLSYSYPPDNFDGVGRLTNLMARGLFECGHHVHVITHGEKEQVSFYDGAYVHKIPYENTRYLHYRRYPNLFHVLNSSHAVYEKIRRLQLNEGIQIVDSPLWLFEGLVTQVSGVLPVVLRLVTAQRQVAKIQDERDKDTRLMGEMEKLLIERSDHVLPNTQATLAAVQEAYGLSLLPERYTVVPYGIVPVPESETRPFDVQSPPAEFEVLFVGRLEKRKGIGVLFKAIPQVLADVPNVRFRIVGADNSAFDGFQRRAGLTYRDYFTRHYAHYTSRVIFEGEVSDTRLQQLYQQCDLFVLPSLYESFGLVYLEAMNYAKPVIGCWTGGVPEVIEQGVSGALVAPGSDKALAAMIVELLQSPCNLHDYGMAGRHQVLEKFSYLQMARRFAEVYRRVIRRAADSPEILSLR